MGAVPDVLTLRSPSKINLHLRVSSPDASGYHPLRSWMITTTLCDELTFTSRHDRPSNISLTCSDPSLPTDGRNLVHRAATAVLSGTTLAADIHLLKRIPAGAGLGGGSGNAATTLVALNRLLKLGQSDAELHAIAATLGSDVPFFLGTPSAIASGRGEVLEACPPPALARHAVLIMPPFPVSTAAAYRALDALRPTAEEATLSPFDAAAWSALPATELLGRLVNDLEPAAFHIEPRLADLRAQVEAALGRTVRMSGSGSALFTLFDAADEATARASRLTRKTGVSSVDVELGHRSGFSD
jgi:4-diphosphocytidyl-2-C-methyl-D-erythritol kinase